MTFTKKILTAIALTLAFGVSAFAGDGNPTCNPDPGTMQSPPCASTQQATDESETATDTQPTSTDVSGITLTEATLDIVQALLTVF